ncbi:hypothetical protein V5799_017155 [Amblyomma americanum]|uniref:Uncharacterized protein n=1 Tax=Amblyomma americanum TaxID=6943 RepID=A0AAQ4F2Y9_AMBAM
MSAFRSFLCVQWDLVCNRRALATLSMFLFGAGLLAGHFLSVLVSHRILPNSPKWLLARGKIGQVEQLLVAIAHTNGKQVDFLYAEKLRASLTRMSGCGRGRSASVASLQYLARLPWAQSSARRRAAVVLVVGLLTGVVSLSQVYLAISMAGNAYLHLLLMSCAELSACVAPLAMLERAGCGLVVFCGCLAGVAACIAHLVLAGTDASLIWAKSGPSYSYHRKKKKE